MRILILAAALVLPTGSSLAQPPKNTPSQATASPNQSAGARLDCVANDVQHAVQPSQTPSANRLGDLPTGDLHLAVMRKVEGCQEPVIVGYGFGAMAAPRRR